MGDEVSSYLQIRGSVPLFWDQPGINVRTFNNRKIDFQILEIRLGIFRLGLIRSACPAVPSSPPPPLTNT